MRLLLSFLLTFILMICLVGFAQAAGDFGSIKTDFKVRQNTTALSVGKAQLKPVTTARIKKTNLLNLQRLKPVIVPKPAKPEGPDPQAAIDLNDVIDDPALLSDLSEVCGWDGHLIFQDKAAGHVFYYLPREFLVRYTEDGYQLSVQYNHRAEPGTPSIMLTAELASPHREGDVSLLKAILKEALQLKPTDKIDLKSIKGLGAQVDMDAVSAGLSLASERINITAPAHLKQPFRLTLLLTQDEVEEVLAQIGREGLSGYLKAKVGEEFVPIPIRIKYTNFAGDRVDGFEQWAKKQSSGNLVNLTMFPLSIESINGYRLKNGKLERISKRLKTKTAIRPQKSKSLKLPPVDRVLGQNLIVSWLDASIDASCTDCIKAIDQAVRKGVALAAGTEIKFEAIPAIFPEFEIYKLMILVRSPYFTVGGKKVLDRGIELTEEENQANISLYLPDGLGKDPLLFKYKFQVITQSGESFTGDEWQNSRQTNNFFGVSQIEGLFDKEDRESPQ